MAEQDGNMVTLTVDGVDVHVAAGTPVIEAAARAGVSVPHYCYHPGIPSRPAQCRMCLVEVEGQPKLQPSCVLAANDGMVILTTSDAAEEARRSVIEFLLLNHPLDCPICDAAGQCNLQDYAFETRQLTSRFRDEKLVLGRDRIADDILYFGDRCIICTRCVRFMSDVAHDKALVVAQRGHKAYIDTFPGRALDNPFRGNIVDVCPVGALVHEDFLFKARAWDLDRAPSVCTGCSTGCNVTLDAKENQIVRLKPRYNPDVNSYWMCDYGRKHLVMSNRGVRAEVPLVREEDRLVPASWQDALQRVVDRLDTVDGGGARVSASASNESLFYFRKLLDRMGIEGGAFRVARGPTAELPGFPKLQLRADRAANATGAESLGFVRAEDWATDSGGALVILEEPMDAAPDALVADREFFLYLGARLSPLSRLADVVLPVATFAEMDGTFTNFEGRVQRFRQALQPPAMARPAWMALSALLSRLGEGEAVTEARTAFGALAAEAPAFSGLEWDAIGFRGARLGALAGAGMEEEGA
jgi:NADH-quinone oxidoreductase subunit G